MNNNNPIADNEISEAVISSQEAGSYDFAGGIIEENNIRISLVPSKRKKTRKVNVIIEGQFNISNAQLVKDSCSKLLLHFDYVSVTLKNIVDIDLAAIQLLHVLKSAPELTQKTITIDSELSKEDRQLLGSAGLMGVVTKQKIEE